MFIPVDPKGTYLRIGEDDEKNQPSFINIAEIGLNSYDYIGLRRVGRYKGGWGSDEYKDDQPHLAGVFWGRSGFINPFDFGDQQPIHTLPSHNDHTVTNIPQDFDLTGDKTTIVRIPPGAERLLFSPNDAWFKDNSDPNNDFGVEVSFPNHPRLTHDSSEHNIDDEMENYEFEIPSNDLYDELESYSDISEDESIDGLKVFVSPIPSPQYRGWYRSGWKPEQSKFKGPRPGYNHGGVDIFAPNKTTVISPVFGRLSRITYNPKGTFGNNAVIIYRKDREVRHCILAHLDDVTARPGLIRPREVVGVAGCSGNAGYGCGRDNAISHGGRTDHVHVEIRAGSRPTNEKDQRDPVGEFGLNISTPGSITVA